jgi:hypothetical protein
MAELNARELTEGVQKALSFHRIHADDTVYLQKA